MQPTNHLFCVCLCVCVCVDSFDSRVDYIAQDGAPFSGLLFANMFVQQLFLGAHRRSAMVTFERWGSQRCWQHWPIFVSQRGAPMNHWQTWWAWVLQRSPDANFGKRLGEAFAQDDLGFLACVWTFGLIGHRLVWGNNPQHYVESTLYTPVGLEDAIGHRVLAAAPGPEHVESELYTCKWSIIDTHRHPSSSIICTSLSCFRFFRAEAAMIFLVSKLASLDFQAADISRFDYTSYICRLFA